MLNFQIKKSMRKCSQTGRDFEPGEVFVSALIENDDGSTARTDFGLDQWEEPPEHCIGWWKSQVPEAGKGKIYWAPRNVMLAFFKHVLNQPTHHDVAYVTALLLIQKKFLTMVDDGKTESMTVRDRSDNESYDVRAVDIAADRLTQIQELLAEQLFMDEPLEDDHLEDSNES
jgi:hypothetical protein